VNTSTTFPSISNGRFPPSLPPARHQTPPPPQILRTTFSFTTTYMPESHVRRKVPAKGGRKTRPPHPSPSPSTRTPPPRRSVKPSKPIKILKRCSSEPMMGWGSGTEDSIDQQKQRRSFLFYESDGGRGVLFRPHTCTDVFLSSPSLIMPTNFSPRSSFDQVPKVLHLISPLLIHC
jgi:hypothetical protein